MYVHYLKEPQYNKTSFVSGVGKNMPDAYVFAVLTTLDMYVCACIHT